MREGTHEGHDFSGARQMGHQERVVHVQMIGETGEIVSQRVVVVAGAWPIGPTVPTGRRARPVQIAEPGVVSSVHRDIRLLAPMTP